MWHANQNVGDATTKHGNRKQDVQSGQFTQSASNAFGRTEIRWSQPCPCPGRATPPSPNPQTQELRATRLAFTHISTLNRAQRSLRHGHSALDHTQTRAQRSHMGSLEAGGCSPRTGTVLPRVSVGPSGSGASVPRLRMCMGHSHSFPCHLHGCYLYRWPVLQSHLDVSSSTLSR